MSRRYDRNGYTNVPEEDEYSLEAILAEYGKGGRQPAQTTEVPEAGAEDSPAPAAEKAPPEPAEAPPAEEEALPTEEVPAEDELYQSDAPDRVALKDIMSQTVDAVLEDGDDGVIEQPVSLGERLAALAQRWQERRSGQKRRPRFQDTEQLFDQPEDEPEEEAPPEPEPLTEDLLRDAKRHCRRSRRSLVLALLPTAALTAAAVLQELEKLPSAWLDEAVLRCAALGGGLLLTALLCMPVWQRAADLLRQGRVGCELCAGVTVLTQLLCCVCGMVTGSTLATPYAAAGALLVVSCQWGLYLETETRRSAYHLLELNGQPPYVASVTAAGVCKQLGRTEGFYRLTVKDDPARLWQNYVLPLLLSAAVVLSGVVCLTGQRMNDFPWVLTSLVTAGMGVAIPLTGVLPLFYLSRRLGRSGCAAAGYAGARALSRPNRLILTDDDLFPSGTVSLNGYKVFGEERSRAVSYAASVAKAAGSSLTPLLERQASTCRWTGCGSARRAAWRPPSGARRCCWAARIS